jgi:chromosome partitioning protein
VEENLSRGFSPPVTIATDHRANRLRAIAMPARIISLLNFKGGVGKTSLSVNLAACLAHTLGQRVLLIDCDLQSNSSIWLLGFSQWNYLNQRRGQTIRGTYLPEATPLRKRIIHHVLSDRVPTGPIHNLDLLPATYELFDFEESRLEDNFYVRFNEELDAVRDDYDYIIFDCPPNLFKASRTAVFASNEIYVPCNPDHLSAIGLNLLIGKLISFYREIEVEALPLADNYRHARIAGVILNNVETTRRIDAIEGMMRMTLSGGLEAVAAGSTVLQQRIRATINAQGVIQKNLPVVVAPGNGNAAFAGLREDYINLATRVHETRPII